MCTREFVLAAACIKYSVPVNHWLAKSNEDRNITPIRFFSSRKQIIPEQLTSSDFKLTIPVNATVGEKTTKVEGQEQRELNRRNNVHSAILYMFSKICYVTFS